MFVFVYFRVRHFHEGFGRYWLRLHISRRQSTFFLISSTFIIIFPTGKHTACRLPLDTKGNYLIPLADREGGTRLAPPNGPETMIVYANAKFPHLFACFSRDQSLKSINKYLTKYGQNTTITFPTPLTKSRPLPAQVKSWSRHWIPINLSYLNIYLPFT